MSLKARTNVKSFSILWCIIRRMYLTVLQILALNTKQMQSKFICFCNLIQFMKWFVNEFHVNFSYMTKYFLFLSSKKWIKHKPFSKSLDFIRFRNRPRDSTVRVWLYTNTTRLRAPTCMFLESVWVLLIICFDQYCVIYTKQKIRGLLDIEIFYCCMLS